MSRHAPAVTTVTIPPGLMAALDRAIDARLSAHGLIRDQHDNKLDIDGDAYIIRRSVGRPPVLVQVSTGREVELPVPAHLGGQ